MNCVHWAHGRRHTRFVAHSALIIGASRGPRPGLTQEWHKRVWSTTARCVGGTALHNLADRSGMPLGVENLDVVKPETTLRQRLAGRRFDVMFVVVGRESQSLPSYLKETFTFVR